MGSTPAAAVTRFGQYALLDRINVGGMAEVFRAKQTGVEGFAKIVAIKRILPSVATDEDFIEMFVTEAKLTVALQHANVVQTYDLGNVEGNYYIAMEYVSGLDLRTLWDSARKRRRLLPIAMSCYIMQRVCEGLDYAHRKRDDSGRDIELVHRDVSPQNILVSFEGEVKVVDFGIAKASHIVSKTQGGVLKGKFGYMAPEQVRGLDLDRRADVFACGVLLWELLVGDRLFLGSSDFETLEKVRKVDFKPPSHFNKKLSPELERIVLRALEKEPGDRYSWCSEMAQDLQRYLFGAQQPFSRQDLQTYIKQHFERELKDESERLERYRNVSRKDLELEAATEPPPPVHPDFLSVELAPEIDPSRARERTNGVSSYSNTQLMDASTRTVSGPISISSPLGVLPASVSASRSGSSEFSPLVAPPMPVAQPVAPLPPVPAVAAAPPSRLPVWAKLAVSLVLLFVLGLGGATVLANREPPPVEEGTLILEASPSDAEISLDGKLMTTSSPFTMNGLAPGPHTLHVQRAGYQPETRTLTISAGHALRAQVKLDPELRFGGLVVRSIPSRLMIWLDGRATGEATPSTLAGLAVGKHLIALRNNNNAELYQKEIEIVQDQIQELEIEVARLPPVLEVLSSPLGARVSIDGVPHGVTPLKLDALPAKSVKLKLEHESCRPIERRVRLRFGEREKVDLSLRCSAPPAVVPAAPGKLNITASAVADVFVDAERVGQTPMLGLKVAAGEREVRLVPAGGHKPPNTRRVHVGPGQTINIQAQF